MRCRLCGHRFEPETLACHEGCPMGSRCSLICCPHCGYQVVDEGKSRLAAWVERAWPGGRRRRRGGHGGRPRPVPEGVPLTHMPVGMGASIRHLEHGRARLLARLSAFGLVPGTHVVVVQRRPVPVLRVGETELAVSDDILDRIWVVPDEGGSPAA